MFGVLHPFLLWGTAAIAVPIAIHLLLRQRPRPRPWAAMRWLRAAMQRAQRRFRLTNLLLLIMRCLIIALLACAVARPSWSVLGRGGELILVIDQSASMGARGDDAGPLAAVSAALAQADLPARVRVIAVADQVRIVADGGAEEARAAVQRLSALPFPGGLDLDSAQGTRSGSIRSEGLLTHMQASADVVLISDFQQDDGSSLATFLQDHVNSVRRWAVGNATANVAIIGLEGIPDPLPNESSEALLQLAGQHQGSIRLAINGGPASEAGRGNRFAIPPLEPGDHRLVVTIDDGGLTYDDRLEIPLKVRGPVPVVIAVDHADYLAASLLADTRNFAPSTGHQPQILPTQLAAEALPPRGLVALRGRSGDGERLARWVQAGGVLWAPLTVLQEDPALQPLLAGLELGDANNGGPFVSGMRDLDEVFALAALATVPAVNALPAQADILLRAGTTPVVIALRAGRGRIIVETAPLSQDPSFTARGATPLWVRRVARRLTASADIPQWWEAGRPVPTDSTDISPASDTSDTSDLSDAITLRRAGLAIVVQPGKLLIVEPGAYRASDGRGNERNIIVTANRDEARIDRAPPPGAARTLTEALPAATGADWGLPLLLAALALLLGEGAFAAWAGRQYAAPAAATSTSAAAKDVA